MRARATGGRGLIFVSLLTLSTGLSAAPAAASAAHHWHARHAARIALRRGGHVRAWHPHYAIWHGISCVPFAREASGIDLPGNAWQWWSNAAGVFARGSLPQLGSVLAFRANPRMRLGHVAVVAGVVNQREIEVDQANWGTRGGITRGVVVIDVSEENDWSAVRVELGGGDQFGSVYPTYGFIYNEVDSGTMLASSAPPAPPPALNPAPSDLRSLAERDLEVAEAPGAAAPVRYRHYRLHHVLRVSLTRHRPVRHKL